MKSVIGIDPGSKQSGYVQWTGKEILAKGIYPNEKLLELLELYNSCSRESIENVSVAVEDMQSIHQKSGRAIIDTLKWAGQFYHAWKGDKEWVTRDQVKKALGAKDDSGVMAVLVLRFGPPGTKKNPGPVTYGLHDHLWAAFAVAVAHLDHLEFQGRELK